jgi:hypothetical protein
VAGGLSVNGGCVWQAACLDLAAALAPPDALRAAMSAQAPPSRDPVAVQKFQQQNEILQLSKT